MCSGGNPIQNISNALAPVNDFHPLKGIIDQPLIDPILQGDMTISGDVVPGSYLDKKNKNLGLTDVQGTAGFFSKGIAGGLGGAAAGGAAGDGALVGADLEATGTSAGSVGGSTSGLGGESSSESMIGSNSDDTLVADASNFVTPEANAGVAGQGDAAAGAMPLAGPTVPTDPATDPNSNTNTGAANPSFLDATVPTAALDPGTAAALGIAPDVPSFTGADAALGNQVAGFSPGGVDSGFVPGTDYSIYTGSQPTDMANPVPDETITPNDVTGAKTPGTLDTMNNALKKVGLNPATAAMLGISGLQALSKPKTPQASRTLEGTAGPGSQQANSVIQSGGTASPAWQTQKTSIDATIDQQIQQQSAAITQQAVNSGQGADSQVTIQQINKLKTQLEAQRQTLYAQAQGQNVQAALQQLGISDQALSGVAAQQYKASQDARSSAANTAQMALMLQALSGRRTDPNVSGGILPQSGEPTG